MSVIYDQLRVSDNGQALLINAHVNKARNFDNVYMKRITICTEDQVSETNPLSFGENFIYQADITPDEEIEPIYDRPQILSENQLFSKMNSNGGWNIPYTPKTEEDNALSVVLSGKFSSLDSEFAPKLVVTTSAFNPTEDTIYDEEVLFTVDGTHHDEKGHQTWLFKGKGDIKECTNLYFYLFKQNSQGSFSYVRLDTTDDFNFLHFLWQIWAFHAKTVKKNLNLVLTRNDFNEKFTASDLSHNMFFVYVECEGTPTPDTPCRLDEMTTLGVTFDYGLMFNQAMNLTRELADTCNIPQNYLNFIMNYDALKLAIETEHYVPAINYWRNITGIRGVLSGNNTSGTVKPCGCHG